MSNSNNTAVFLGGSCNPTTWRKDIAIPALEAAGVTFYNPQIDDWHEGLVALEREAKENADTLLFVIDGQTRAGVSMLEATEFIMAGRKVVVVITDIPDGTEIEGAPVTGRDLKDANRMRTYFREIAEKHGASVFDSIEDAVAALV